MAFIDQQRSPIKEFKQEKNCSILLHDTKIICYFCTIIRRVSGITRGLTLLNLLKKTGF